MPREEWACQASAPDSLIHEAGKLFCTTDTAPFSPPPPKSTGCGQTVLRAPSSIQAVSLFWVKDDNSRLKRWGRGRYGEWVNQPAIPSPSPDALHAIQTDSGPREKTQDPTSHMHMSQDQVGSHNETATIAGARNGSGENYRGFGLGSLRFLQSGFAGIQIQASVLQDPSLFLRGGERGKSVKCKNSLRQQLLLWKFTASLYIFASRVKQNNFKKMKRSLAHTKLL